MNKINVKLKKIIDKDFFELPKPKFSSWKYCLKYRMTNVFATPENAEIFVANKTSDLDKYFLSYSIKSDFVFLKDCVIERLYASHKKGVADEIVKKVSEMLQKNISVVIFPERHRTVFGDYAYIPEKITSVVKALGTKINFCTLIGTYFIRPIWSEKINSCQTKLDIRFSIKKETADRLDEAEFNAKFNEFMPSSASTYTLRYPLYLYGDRRAENLETILYACPNCEKLFSLYSEFACVKCSECGTPFELASDGEISLAKSFDSLDSAKEFQRELLQKFDLDGKLVIGYKNIKMFEGEAAFLKKKNFEKVTLRIFCDRLEIVSEEKNFSLNFGKIEDLALLENNTLLASLGEEKKYFFVGENKENFYVAIDLLENFTLKK